MEDYTGKSYNPSGVDGERQAEGTDASHKRNSRSSDSHHKSEDTSDSHEEDTSSLDHFQAMSEDGNQLVTHDYLN
ncbi:uncharacterized [Tachysurus ichikawai]